MNSKKVILIQVMVLFLALGSMAQDLVSGPQTKEKLRHALTIDLNGKFVLAKPLRIERKKEDRNNTAGAGFFALPEAIVNAQSAIVYVEFERFLNERNAIVGRLDYIGYSYIDDVSAYYESGSGVGGGVGFSYRHYFSDYGGFFIGPAVELAVVSWDYDYRNKFGLFSEYGTGTSLGIAPNVAAGYCLNIGDRFSISPALMIGYRFGLGLESEGDVDEESGPIGGFGASFKFRFNSDN